MKLTETEVADIRAAYRAKENQGALAEKYGVSIHVVRDICSNRTYHDPAYEPPFKRPPRARQKLDDEKIEGIKLLHARGLSMQKIADHLQIALSLVHRIVHSVGTTDKHGD